MQLTKAVEPAQKVFFIRRDKKDALRLRIHFLIYEADVDLLEIGVFAATVNLAVLTLEATTAGLPTHTFDFMFQHVKPVVWFSLLLTLAFVQLGASLLNSVFVRCWGQFASFIAFLAYAGFVMCKSPWIPSPRDYVIFAILAGVAHLRLRQEARDAGKSSLSNIVKLIKQKANAGFIHNFQSAGSGQTQTKAN